MVMVLVLAGAGDPAHADEVREAPVPTATIYPGDAIRPESLVKRRFYASTLRRAQAVERAEDAIGKITRRTLVPGRPIPVSALAMPSTVTRGVPAPVVFRNGALTITGRAAPLRSAAAGEMVEARNVETGLVITGRVTTDGVIEVISP